MQIKLIKQHNLVYICTCCMYLYILCMASLQPDRDIHIWTHGSVGADITHKNDQRHDIKKSTQVV